MMPDRLRHRLLQRIARRYQTRTLPVDLGPVRLQFTRIADPDRVLDQVAAEEDRREKSAGRRLPSDELHLPYWAELWDSAWGIGRFLVDHDVAQDRGDALDLGCGMGLAGTVAAALGWHVLFADIESHALLFAALNSLPWHTRVRLRRLDWRRDTLNERFDLILGADILYERAQWDCLEPFWRAHLTPGGAVLLGEPGRQTGELFVSWITQRPWRLETFQQPVPTRARPVRIFRLTASPES